VWKMAAKALRKKAIKPQGQARFRLHNSTVHYALLPLLFCSLLIFAGAPSFAEESEPVSGVPGTPEDFHYDPAVYELTIRARDLECFAFHPVLPRSVVVELGQAATNPDFTVTESHFIVNDGVVTGSYDSASRTFVLPVPNPNEEKLTVDAYVAGQFTDRDGLPYQVEASFNCWFYRGEAKLPAPRFFGFAEENGYINFRRIGVQLEKPVLGCDELRTPAAWTVTDGYLGEISVTSVNVLGDTDFELDLAAETRDPTRVSYTCGGETVSAEIGNRVTFPPALAGGVLLGISLYLFLAVSARPYGRGRRLRSLDGDRS
jgi:hypothetical protein